MRLEVLWRQLAGSGAEHLMLEVKQGVHADSLAVGEVDGSAYRIHYQIDCDTNWNVQSLVVEDLLGKRTLSCLRRGDGWMDVEGHTLQELGGCVDVDIMITPFTNTLPIRRLKLKAGEARQISVVYISVPELTATKFEQRYTYLAADENGGRYLYESLESGFKAELRVDGDGLVVDYPGIFEMDAKRPLAEDQPRA